jgi:hypothetical protein
MNFYLQKGDLVSVASFLRALSTEVEAEKILEAFLPSAWNLLQLHALTAVSAQEDFTFSRLSNEACLRKDGSTNPDLVQSISECREWVVGMTSPEIKSEMWRQATTHFVSIPICFILRY